MRLPLWFKATVVGSLTLAFLVFFAVRDPGVQEAIARTAFETLVRAQQPFGFLPTSLQRPAWGKEPDRGSYRVNGMRVDYSTVPASRGRSASLDDFEAAFKKTGYTTKRVEVEKRTVLAGFHPETKMLLTVQPREDERGRPELRLTQTHLGTIDANFVPEIPGIPMMNDASGAVVVTQVSGPRATSLQYTSVASPEWVAEYYAKEMRVRGWSVETPPVGAPGGGAALLFFTKEKEECAVVVARSEDLGGSMVMVTLTERTA